MTCHVIVPCTSWEQFKAEKLSDLYGGQALDRSMFYFRGQRSSKQKLLSSFDRWFGNHKGTRALKQKASERFLELFVEETQRSEETSKVTEDTGVLALAQHHGVPTRLLDWTESPYIAAFFAFAGIADSTERIDTVAVWALDRSSPIWTKENGVELLSIASPYNQRLKNQLGKFTYLRAPYDTLEEHVAHFDGEDSSPRRFDIPATEAYRALADLDAMGINYSTVYPGLDGAASAAKLRMLLEAQSRGYVAPSV